MPHPMTIGQAAQAAGVSAKMIRHYERLGLLPAVARTDAGYRQYTEPELAVLRFIRQSRQLGFSMKQIAELLGLWTNPHRASREVKALAQLHIDELARKMREIAAMKRTLEDLVARCHGDDQPHCAILDELAGPDPRAPAGGPAQSTSPHGDAVALASANTRRSAQTSAPRTRQSNVPKRTLTV